jgi:hypothetical protein
MSFSTNSFWTFELLNVTPVVKVKYLYGNCWTFLFTGYHRLKMSGINYKCAELVRLWIHSFIYGSAALCWTVAAFSVPNLFAQFVGFLGWGMSLLQGHCLNTGYHKQNKRAQTSMPQVWDLNPRSSVWAGKDSLCLRLGGHCDWQDY